ncbi:MAG: 23S rRNA (pseudouridine(1915)-N(3))-methyltransferase RlmH [Clostridiales bacterium]|nr:23S rRNA (pseudouridine(1915)-N(3))-methyltransferase RlmH [Clostridiales bacterium]
MFQLRLICMGKLKEQFYLSAAGEYAKRLRAFCDFALIELPECRLPEAPNPTQIAQGLSEEAARIRAKIPKGSFFCVFAPEGKQLSSPELAGTLGGVKSSGKSCACFLIGSSFGVDAGLKAQADLLLSMSTMTFPHHLARVMALEQLYRAESIQAGTKYHK